MKAERAKKAITILKALSSPIRADMVALLMKRDARPSYLRKKFKMSQPRVDYHLSFLVKAKVVYRRKRKDGDAKNANNGASFFCLDREALHRIESAINLLNEQ